MMTHKTNIQIGHVYTYPMTFKVTYSPKTGPGEVRILGRLDMPLYSLSAAAKTIRG